MQFAITVLVAAAAVVQAANNVHQHVVYSATGAADVVANQFGCVNITPSGASSQLGCIKHVFNNGFTVGVTDNRSKAKTLCSIAGSSGTCGPANAQLTVNVDLTGGTGTAPPPSGPGGTTTLSAAELQNLPIPGNSALAAAGAAATGSAPAAVASGTKAAGKAAGKAAAASATGTKAGGKGAAKGTGKAAAASATGTNVAKAAGTAAGKAAASPTCTGAPARASARAFVA